MDKLSTDASTTCPATFAGQSVTIFGDMTPSEFKRAFTGRVRRLRESLGWERKEFAKEMGVTPARWIKYETRTPLPHYLVPRFCRTFGVDVWYLFTGEHASKAPARPQDRRGAK